MNFYETTFILRQDISQADVERITKNFVDVLTGAGAEIIKTEYWGLRNLAYIIRKNKKGHYVMIGSRANHEAIKEVERKMSISEDVLKKVSFNVEKLTKEPSAMIASTEEEVKPTVTRETKEVNEVSNE